MRYGALCNNSEGQKQLRSRWATCQLKNPERLDRMRKKGGRDLRKSVAYREAQQALTILAYAGGYLGLPPLR